MSKSKFFKILIATLSLCLLIGAVVGVSAMAADDGESKGVVVDFDSDFSEYLTYNVGNPANAEANTFEVVEVDGNKKLKLTKTVTGDGMYVKPNVTYKEEGGNVAILEFDVRYENIGSNANQITVSHAFGSGNKYSPFLISLPKRYDEDLHVTLKYRATSYKENGDVATFELSWQINDEAPTIVNTVAASATNILNGNSKIPAPADFAYYSIDLNYSFTGTAYYDNFSARVVHEHQFNGAVCVDCGYVDPDFKGPVIWSKNIEYGSKTYLYYAVTAESISEADKAAGFWMQVMDADGTVVIEKLLPEENTTMVEGKECYVFISRGVPAKELNTKELVQVITASGLQSSTEAYCVEDYLYQKLYTEGYAAKTANDIGEDGKDYIRRNLYYSLLKYGAIAQELLSPDAADKIGDTNYATAPAGKYKLGELQKGTVILLDYADSSNVADLLAWEYTQYDSFGELVFAGYAQNKSKITVDDGYFFAKPIYWEDIDYHITFDGQDDLDEFTVSTGYPTSNLNGTAQLLDKNGNVIGTDASKTETEGGIKGVAMSTTGLVTNGGNAALSLNKIYKLSNGNLSNPNIKLNSVTSAEENASVAIFEADILANTDGTSTFELYFILTPKSGSAGTNGVYYGYMASGAKGNGATISIKNDFYYNSAGSRQSVAVNKSMGVKTGESFTLRVEYWEADALGDALVKIFADGALIHETSVISGKNYHQSGKAPQAEDVGNATLQIGGSNIADMQVDNVALAQLSLPRAELIGADRGVVDFDSITSGYTPYVGNTNTYKIVTDEITGESYLEFHKTKNVSGASIKIGVTEKENNANLMVYEADVYIPSSVSMATQFNAGTSSGDGNTQTPFMPTIQTELRNQWVRIRLEYQALEVDAAGNAVRVCIRVYENGKLVGSNDPKQIVEGWSILSSNHPTTNGVYTGATALTKIPLPSDMTSVKIALNNAFNGNIRFDNISLKLLHVEGCDPIASAAE